MIQQISNREWQLVKGNHSMTLRFDGGAYWMSTVNPSTRAWALGNRNLGSLKRFESLSDVEQHYKSWRGVAALVAA